MAMDCLKSSGNVCEELINRDLLLISSAGFRMYKNASNCVSPNSTQIWILMLTVREHIKLCLSVTSSLE